MDNNTYRHESKYICNEISMKQIENRVKSVMKNDYHTGNRTDYLVRSIYFDDVQNSCFYENENGNDPRSKYRIRSYNCSADYIVLEKKIKKNNMTAKKSYQLSYDDFKKMISGEMLTDKLGLNGVFDEWIIERNSHLLRPVLLIEYIRTPFVYTLGNVRVTFDRHIMVSDNIDELFNKDISKIPVLPQDVNVLEVKYNDYLPDTIRYLVNDMHVSQKTFSKFFLGSLALKGGYYNVI